jgi:CheY-like chemotaxis protein
MFHKVLIVDDVQFDRQNLERIVSDAGCQTITSDSGADAVARAKQHKPDLIMMDVNMPDIDGFAATRLLKADDATKAIPVVFVTGKDQKADKAWGQILGAKGYITKPYSREQILEQLKG